MVKTVDDTEKTIQIVSVKISADKIGCHDKYFAPKTGFSGLLTYIVWLRQIIKSHLWKKTGGI